MPTRHGLPYLYGYTARGLRLWTWPFSWHYIPTEEKLQTVSLHGAKLLRCVRGTPGETLWLVIKFIFLSSPTGSGVCSLGCRRLRWSYCVEHLGAQQCQLPVPWEPLVFDDVFKRFRKIWNNDFVLFISVCPSVCFSAWNSSALAGRISVKFCVEDFW